MTTQSIKLLFVIAGLYDLLIGALFLLTGAELLDWAQIPQPPHMGYLQFAALQLVIFGCMFFTVSRDPVSNRNLIPYGILLKISYVSIVLYYLTKGTCPTLFQPFAAIDAVMLVLFVMAWRQPVGEPRSEA